MIDMNKMVEVVAKAIFREMLNCVDPENVGLCETRSKDAANAAVKAFCKELPCPPEDYYKIDGEVYYDIDGKRYHVPDDVEVYDSEYLYNKLKEYGKDA